MHIGSLPGYLRGIAESISLEEGSRDCIVHNHPYKGFAFTGYRRCDACFS